MKFTDSMLEVQIDVSNSAIYELKKYLFEMYDNDYYDQTHLTIMKMPFELEFLNDTLKQHLFDSCSELKEFIIGDLYFEPLDKFFALDIQSSNLQEIHMELLHLANNYRNDLYRKKDQDRFDTDYYTEKQKKMLKKFGFARAGECYKPHITIGSIKTETSNEELETIMDYMNAQLESIVGTKVPITEVHIRVAISSSTYKLLHQETQKI